MTDPRELMAPVNRRLNRVLTAAEAALPQDQFKAFRKLALDEFGRSGLEQDFADCLAESAGPERNGKGRN